MDTLARSDKDSNYSMNATAIDKSDFDRKGEEMMSIHVDQLSKTFSYYKKEVGLKSSVRNLFFRKKLEKEAVNNLSFQIEEGEIVGFLGPNGAGKTTTLKMLAGILHPSGGNISIFGYTPWERKKEFKKIFSIVMGQKSQLWWDLPANESLNLNKYIYEISDREFNYTLDELSELLDVRDLLKVQVRRLSLGERMKMELISSLIHKPKVMFLDEPTIGLDFVSQKKIREFIKHYNGVRKTTIILTSHYMNDIEDLCKRAIIINKGSVVFDGALKGINRDFSPKKIIKLSFSDPVPEEIIRKFGQVREYDQLHAVLEVHTEQLKTVSSAMLNELPVLDFTIEDIPIDESISLFYKKGETG